MESVESSGLGIKGFEKTICMKRERERVLDFRGLGPQGSWGLTLVGGFGFRPSTR